MTNVFLRPLSLLFGCLVHLRNLLFDFSVLRVYHSKIPVISIGNIGVGGSGKTPLALFIAQRALVLGRKPVILSRGYGGSLAGPHRVSSSDTAVRVGDEPLLLARRAGCPVVIARKRVLGAQYIEQQALGDLIILDDGFQHRWLGRVLDIVCVDLSTEQACVAFQSGRILPEGRLREFRDYALRRASAVVCTVRSLEAPTPSGQAVISQCFKGLPLFISRIVRSTVVHTKTGENLTPQPVSLVSAIANPEALEATLCRAGFTVAQKFHFPDHHMFSDSEIESALKKNGQLPIVCTEKDIVKVPLRFLAQFYVIGIETELQPALEFDRLISGVGAGN